VGILAWGDVQYTQTIRPRPPHGPRTEYWATHLAGQRWLEVFGTSVQVTDERCVSIIGLSPGSVELTATWAGFLKNFSLANVFSKQAGCGGRAQSLPEFCEGIDVIAGARDAAFPGEPESVDAIHFGNTGKLLIFIDNLLEWEIDVVFRDSPSRLGNCFIPAFDASTA